ncbi:hypothetical protein [Mangrovimonas sp. ST2L15]|uniref:hypothetical protein n=1 Tax=Mangrovimonas sp. ST2L15 TaxID=1645916 RepID=UPI0006B5C9A6|nr:hypothetical protein [Mangrovimonas sp. ST2L15]
MKKSLYSSFLILFFTVCGFAQEGEMELENESFERHQIGLLISHVHTPNTYSGDKKQWRALPGFSLYYNFWLNKHWAIGLHTDFINETFQVEKYLSSEEESLLERERPIAPALMGVYKPGEHFAFLLGAGGEFAKGDNLFLIRAEVAYTLEIHNGLEFEVTFGDDFRIDAYNTLTLGVGLSKSF